MHNYIVVDDNHVRSHIDSLKYKIESIERVVVCMSVCRCINACHLMDIVHAYVHIQLYAHQHHRP